MKLHCEINAQISLELVSGLQTIAICAIPKLHKAAKLVDAKLQDIGETRSVNSAKEMLTVCAE